MVAPQAIVNEAKTVAAVVQPAAEAVQKLENSLSAKMTTKEIDGVVHSVAPFVRNKSNVSELTGGLAGGVQTIASYPSQLSGMIAMGVPITQVIKPELNTGNQIIDGIGGTVLGTVGMFVPIHAAGHIIAGAGEKIAGVTGAVVGGIGNTANFVNKAIGNDGVGDVATSLKTTGDSIKNAGVSAMKPLHITSDVMGAPFQMVRESKLGDLANVGTMAVDNIAINASKLGIKNEKFYQGLQTAHNKIEGVESSVKGGAKNLLNKVAGEEKAGAIIDNLKERGTYKTVRQAAAIGTIVAQNTNTVHGFVEAYDKLAEMYGKKDAKVTDVLFDQNVDPLFAKARKETMGNIPAAALISVVSNVAQWKLANNQNISTGIGGKMGAVADIGSMMAAIMLPQMALNHFKPNSEILNLHSAACDSYEAYGQVPAELTAHILKTQSPSFSGRSQAIATNLVADHYAENNIPPAQIFKAVSSGEAASLGYMLMEQRTDKMRAYDLVDADPEQKIVPIAYQSPIRIPQDRIYDYAAINRATDLDELTQAVATFIVDTQPSFADGGKNEKYLPQIAQIAALEIATKGMAAEDVVNRGSSDLVLKSFEKMPPELQVASNSVEMQGRLQDRALAMAGAGGGRI